MNTPWRPHVDIYVDGERIDAQTANRPIEQLAAQAQHLKERVTALDPSAGKMIFADAPLDADTVVGDFVYFNGSSNTFGKALAEAETDDLGQYVASSSSFVVGLISTKVNATLGDVMQTGRLNLSDAGINPNDLVEDPINDPFVPGRYYLSRRIPGKMTRHPSSPTILLGYFTATECFVFPQQRDLFETHFHYHFDLISKPSASQNFLRTGSVEFGDDVLRVDYFNRNTDTAPPDILLCVRSNGNLPASVLEPIRVDIYKGGDDLLGITIQKGVGLDYDDPQSTGADEEILTTIEWPAYGEWVGIPNTNLDIAFIRQDGVYTDTLEVDATNILTANTDQWKVWLPDDLSGWTNANPLEIATPTEVLLRYLHESQENLNNVFPPVPAEASFIQLNGTAMAAGIDFKVSNLGIFWIPSKKLSDTSQVPWPFDYDSTTGAVLDGSNTKLIQFHFTRTGLRNANAVVLSLIGIPPIVVKRCPGGEDASTGDLQVSIDLKLLESDQVPSDSNVAYFNVNGLSFQKTNIVARLEAGTGTRIERVSGGNTNTGVLRIHHSDMKFEGEIDDITLRNAKEGVSAAYSFIAFPSPITIASGITSTFKTPNQDYDVSQFKLDIKGQFFGDAAVQISGSSQRAILKAAIHVIRPGFSLAALNDASAVDLQYWIFNFEPGYVATTMLSPELPHDVDDLTKFQISATTLAARPSSLVALNDGFKLGDIYVVQLDRVKSEPNGLIDDYTGRLGMAGLRWILT